MSARSWRHLGETDSRLALPEDLRRADERGAVDVGWIEQMIPFVLAFSRPGEVVLDPFAGLGTTLLAAALQGRRAVGIEIDAARARLARARLARHGFTEAEAKVVVADARALPVGPGTVTLALTNLPYFSVAPASPGAEGGQLYAAPSYLAYLDLLDDALVSLDRALAPRGVIVMMAQNLRGARGELIPQAWDAGRLLSRRFLLREERILLYDRPRGGEGDPFSTDRSHEYALVAEKVRPELDEREARDLLRALGREEIAFAVYGSFAAKLRGEPLSAPPSDLDLVVARCDLAALAATLVLRGFELRSWGERVAPPLDPAKLEGRWFLRATGPAGSRLSIDVTYEEGARIEAALAGRVAIDGMWALGGPFAPGGQAGERD